MNFSKSSPDPTKIRAQFASNCTTQKHEFDRAELENLLEPDNKELRSRLKTFLCREEFKPKYACSLEEERETAYRRMKLICENNFISVRDFLTDANRIFTVHELCAIMAPAMTTKLTVQFNLFGGTVLKFGTETHHATMLDDIDSLKTVGCFGLTELGFGNNAVEMETEAVYDEKTDQFVINSPTPLSQKYWITNGAIHAHQCIVFAQLIYHGQSEGIHAFLVPIRDENLQTMRGVTIHEMGVKIGLNGVDNAKIQFDEVRVPRAALLNKFSTIDENGKFSSKVSSMRGRFLVVVDQLLSGRICIATTAISGCKMGMLITVRYAASRLGLGPTGKSEMPIMQYQSQQKSLMPLLAKTLVLNVALNRVRQNYVDHTTAERSNGTVRKTWRDEEIVMQCCAIKAMSAWHFERVANVCRERCGGQGYLQCNQFGVMFAAAHAAITAEGDSSVLMQKVAKERLTLFEPQPEAVRAETVRLAAAADLDDMDTLHALLVMREEALCMRLGTRMMAVMDDRTELFNLCLLRESELIQASSLAYGQVMLSAWFREAIDVVTARHAHTGQLLRDVYKLWAVSIVKENAAQFVAMRIVPSLRMWIVEGNGDNGGGGDQQFAEEFTFDAIIDRVCGSLAASSLDIVNSFGIPEGMLTVPIAQNWLDYNVHDNRGEVACGALRCD